MSFKFKLGVGACGFNLGMLVVNLGFRNADAIAALNPDMFSAFGQGMVVIWGATYLAAGIAEAGAAVWCAFALEKLAYAVGWLRWMSRNDAVALVSAAAATGDLGSVLAAVFHASYGPGDAAFMLAFLYAATVREAPKRD
mmetsp:Transcript_136881/g.437927  ORF Transcript_136881/g.437927 Transcript_136881/m.437927 type:complete len:140 (-) Transcript_136881:487-906(-)|eukprot:CAMPEP_0203890818 /NCGR_PEP_ID=MMETSP0359-20131031/34208_1 /ASSEMBLY_ACC=CAM_ASM_000338 /TAXON_ID=268821 /ORGANISM="Scrippsiella Hangoei, Strain SHTV-5" /LENGTH=139 /DNA_ID=CAMNT_0050812515 /DNA_START=112 /DNA_END=531 /DNA_ORIENTATION=-